MGSQGCFLPSELPWRETGAGCLEEGRWGGCVGDDVFPWALLTVRFSLGLLCASSLCSSPRPFCSLALGSWGPFPSRCPSPLQQQVNVVRAGFPARAAVDGWGLETEASPLPSPGSPLCHPLGCPAAQSLAPAHIPAVTLWVSGLELVSVRGTEFSQD